MPLGKITCRSKSGEDASHGCCLSVFGACSHHCSRTCPSWSFCPPPWKQNWGWWSPPALCWGLSKVSYSHLKPHLIRLSSPNWMVGTDVQCNVWFGNCCWVWRHIYMGCHCKLQVCEDEFWQGGRCNFWEKVNWEKFGSHMETVLWQWPYCTCKSFWRIPGCKTGRTGT